MFIFLCFYSQHTYIANLTTISNALSKVNVTPFHLICTVVSDPRRHLAVIREEEGTDPALGWDTSRPPSKVAASWVESSARQIKPQDLTFVAKDSSSSAQHDFQSACSVLRSSFGLALPSGSFNFPFPHRVDGAGHHHAHNPQRELSWDRCSTFNERPPPLSSLLSVMPDSLDKQPN